MTFTENPTYKTQNPASRNVKGNAMVYVLIALALFGVLTMTLSRQNEQSDGQDIDDEVLQVYANELIEYMNGTQQVIDMMIFSGSEIGDLDFVNPTSTGFDTDPYTHKVFHPQGGGLNYQEKFNPRIRDDSTSAWVVNKSINVGWSDTSGNDVILTAYFITRDICELLNLKITGSTTIPATNSPHADYFSPTGSQDFTAAECAACDGYPSLCVENDTGDGYSFYRILVAQ